MSQTQIETLLKQKKYRQAIDEIKKLQRSQPNVTLSIDESIVWAYRGRDELMSDDVKAAENEVAETERKRLEKAEKERLATEAIIAAEQAANNKKKSDAEPAPPVTEEPGESSDVGDSSES